MMKPKKFTRNQDEARDVKEAMEELLSYDRE
jgi:hypothetical protein